MHIMEGFVYLVQRLTVGDELIHFEFAVQVVLDQPWQLGAALDTSEGATAPNSL
jgi:hypothetical protein